jgi:hypothetical protein
MAKITTIDDYPLYAHMVADFLRSQGGHEVQTMVWPIMPSEIASFGPSVIVVALVRKIESIGHGPMHDFYTEVDGAKAFRELASGAAGRGIPIVLTSIGVKESEVPQDLPYDAFVPFPQELDRLLMAIDKLVKARESGSG